eukprot:jgi/Chlat1/2231/Chrsp17S02547
MGPAVASSGVLTLSASLSTSSAVTRLPNTRSGSRGGVGHALVHTPVRSSARGGGFVGDERLSLPTLRTLQQHRSSRKHLVIQNVIPQTQGEAYTQTPPDLPSYLFKQRIIYLGMTLVPSVTELILAQLMYLQWDDNKKPIYMYINSTGVQKGGEKYGFETEAFAIIDTIQYMAAPIYTLAIGNAYGEAAMLLAAGAKGHRAALPSASIMIREPIQQFRGQATDIMTQRNLMRQTNREIALHLSQCTGHPIDKIAADVRRPKYFTPHEAKEYGLIDMVLEAPKKQPYVPEELRGGYASGVI